MMSYCFVDADLFRKCIPRIPELGRSVMSGTPSTCEVSINDGGDKVNGGKSKWYKILSRIIDRHILICPLQGDLDTKYKDNLSFYKYLRRTVANNSADAKSLINQAFIKQCPCNSHVTLMFDMLTANRELCEWLTQTDDTNADQKCLQYEIACTLGLSLALNRFVDDCVFFFEQERYKLYLDALQNSLSFHLTDQASEAIDSVISRSVVFTANVDRSEQISIAGSLDALEMCSFLYSDMHRADNIRGLTIGFDNKATDDLNAFAACIKALDETFSVKYYIGTEVDSQSEINIAVTALRRLNLSFNSNSIIRTEQNGHNSYAHDRFIVFTNSNDSNKCVAIAITCPIKHFPAHHFGGAVLRTKRLGASDLMQSDNLMHIIASYRQRQTKRGIPYSL